MPTKRRPEQNGASTAETRGKVSVSTDFRNENASKRWNIETERRRKQRVGSANAKRANNCVLIITTISKRRRAATKEEKQNGALDEKRRKRRTKPRDPRQGKTALAPRRRRRRRNVVDDVCNGIRVRRTQKLDDGGWVTLILAKVKGKRFSRRSFKTSERTDGESAKIGERERAAFEATFGERRALKRARRFPPIQRPYFTTSTAEVKRGEGVFSLIRGRFSAKKFSARGSLRS